MGCGVGGGTFKGCEFEYFKALRPETKVELPEKKKTSSTDRGCREYAAVWKPAELWRTTLMVRPSTASRAICRK